MHQSENFSTKAILLKKFEYGEADTIFVFYSEDRGKIKAFARSARKSTKRFGSSLDLYSFVRAHFSQSKREGSLYNLNSTSNILIFENIRKSVMKIAQASFMLELFYEMTAENVTNINLFHFLCAFLDDLNGSAMKINLFSFYSLKFLRLVGLGPNFSECSVCGNKPDQRIWFFRFDKGGIACPSCLSSNGLMNYKISRETLNVLEKEGEMGLSFLKRISPSKGCQNELAYVVNRFIEYNLGKRLNSFNFLKELSDGAGF